MPKKIITFDRCTHTHVYTQFLDFFVSPPPKLVTSIAFCFSHAPSQSTNVEFLNPGNFRRSRAAFITTAMLRYLAP